MTDERRSQTGWIGVQEWVVFLPGPLARFTNRSSWARNLQCSAPGNYFAVKCPAATRQTAHRRCRSNSCLGIVPLHPLSQRGGHARGCLSQLRIRVRLQLGGFFPDLRDDARQHPRVHRLPGRELTQRRRRRGDHLGRHDGHRLRSRRFQHGGFDLRFRHGARQHARADCLCGRRKLEFWHGHRGHHLRRRHHHLRYTACLQFRDNDRDFRHRARPAPTC